MMRIQTGCLVLFMKRWENKKEDVPLIILSLNVVMLSLPKHALKYYKQVLRQAQDDIS